MRASFAKIKALSVITGTTTVILIQSASLGIRV
jgi:hypothetical protein